LHVSYETDARTSGNTLDWNLRCAAGALAATTDVMIPTRSSDVVATFSVPDACPAQIIELAIASPRDDTPIELDIHRIAISRLPS
jgi:hypothetical protein